MKIIKWKYITERETSHTASQYALNFVKFNLNNDIDDDRFRTLRC